MRRSEPRRVEAARAAMIVKADGKARGGLRRECEWGDPGVTATACLATAAATLNLLHVERRAADHSAHIGSN